MKPYLLSFTPVLILLALGFLLLPVCAEDAPVSHERLVLVCANLKNAVALASGGSATSVAVESERVSSLSDAALLKEILKLADAVSTSFTDAPRDSRPDIFAYTRDARLAMIDNRKEPFAGHQQYVRDHPKKAQGAVNQCVQDIKQAVGKLRVP